MTTLSQLPINMFTLGLFLFLIFTLQNMFAARFVNAPNSGLNISFIATLLISFCLIIFVFLAKYLNILSTDSYHFIFISFALAVNIIICSIIFNVNLIKGAIIIFIGYLLTAAVVCFSALVMIHAMGFNDYQDAIKLIEPHIYDVMMFFT